MLQVPADALLDTVEITATPVATFANLEFDAGGVVIQPRLDAASSSCAAAKKAIATVIGYERRRQLMVYGESGHDTLDWPFTLHSQQVVAP